MKQMLMTMRPEAVFARDFLCSMLQHSREALPGKAFDMAAEFVREAKKRHYMTIRRR